MVRSVRARRIASNASRNACGRSVRMWCKNACGAKTHVIKKRACAAGTYDCSAKARNTYPPV